MPSTPPPNGFSNMPLGGLLVLFLGGPVIMLLTFGGWFWAKGASVQIPNHHTGQIYAVCIALGCRHLAYLTHRQLVIYDITQAPIWGVGALGAASIVAAGCIILWKKHHPKQHP
jgi:hypothetical protein